MERSQLFKFVFLVIISLLMLVFTLYGFFGGEDKDEDNLEDMFDRGEEDSDDDLDIDDFDIDTDDISEDTTDEVSVDSKDSENDSEKEVSGVDLGDLEALEKHNYDKFGEKKVEKAKDISKSAVTMWLEQEDDVGEWKDISTSSFLDFVERNLSENLDEVSRKVDSIEVFALGDEREDDMTIEARVTWFYDKDGELYNQQKQLIYLTFSMEKDNPLVSELIDM